jgi:hypothetical protein
LKPFLMMRIDLAYGCTSILRSECGEFGQTSSNVSRDSLKTGLGVNTICVQILEVFLIGLQVNLEKEGGKSTPIEFHVKIQKTGVSNH